MDRPENKLNTHQTFQGVRMNVVSTDPSGVVNADTIFEFTQEGTTVSATYRGGGVEIGFLVGAYEDNRLSFRYVQREVDGKLDGGHSECDVELADDGRLRVIEHFQWESRDKSGTNVFEQVERCG